ncbi:hypothetical protein HMI55_001791 [Coelomomyces lativittatus]|nr:hypothetical protein HMI55_001791 [Coelomomyces lativittatus]
MVFEPFVFYPLATFPPSHRVPILTVGGLAKQFMVPGWRVGWILIHDPHELMSSVRQALFQLSAVLIGANTLIQSALPDILFSIPSSYHRDNNVKLQACANVALHELQGVPFFDVLPPQGAMYMMLRLHLSCFRDIHSDIDFIQKLMMEESVMCLPGKCFCAPDFIRIVTCISPEVMKEACSRIRSFCFNHSK